MGESFGGFLTNFRSNIVNARVRPRRFFDSTKLCRLHTGKRSLECYVVLLLEIISAVLFIVFLVRSFLMKLNN